MRGQQERSGSLFSYISTEVRIPPSHPLRQVRRLADQTLDRFNPSFCKLYPEGGRPSIPPEQLLLALLLQAIYGIRSERMLFEQLDYNRLCRWFAGLNPGDPVWHTTTFIEKRDRLLNEELMARFLELLPAAPEVKPLLHSKYFSVDGTLLRGWASQAPWSGSMVLMTDRHHPMVASVLDVSMAGTSSPRASFATFCFLIGPTAPPVTTRPGWSRKPQASALS
jgi:transposase